MKYSKTELVSKRGKNLITMLFKMFFLKFSLNSTEHQSLNTHSMFESIF